MTTSSLSLSLSVLLLLANLAVCVRCSVCSRRMVKDAEDVNAWLQKREREIKKELEDFRAYDLADTHTDDASPQATPTPEQVVRMHR